MTASVPPERLPPGRAVTAEDVLAQVKRGPIRFIELHFTDVAGAIKSVVLPAGQLRETLDYGHWFDGSSLEGAARLMESDLILRPDLSTWSVLPWSEASGDRTARLICDVETPDGTPFPADPRAVLRRAIQDAGERGLRYLVAPEVEFFLFRAGAGEVQAAAQIVAAGPADSAGYFDAAARQGERVRDEMIQTLGALGVPVAASHHEIGPGQQEIDLPLLPALAAADAIVTCKFIAKAVARRFGLVATFMPKPLAGAAGSGLHLHQVLLDEAGACVLQDAGDQHGLSQQGRSFLAGQLAHGRAMCAVLAPTVNSYKRLGHGFDAPGSLAWSHSNPLAAIHVVRAAMGGAPAGSRGRGGGGFPRRLAVAAPLDETAHAWSGVDALRVELRCADPSCNPYLALAVALAAGLDGIRRGLSAPAPLNDTGADHAPDEAHLEVLPASLGEAIGELEWDPVVRDALGAPVYERFLAAKEREWQEYRRQISTWELERYFEPS